jgi:hypothetical protein
MQWDVGLRLLTQGLPVITEILSALQTEYSEKLKHKQAVELKQATQRQHAVELRQSQVHLATLQRETLHQFVASQQVLEHWPLGLLPAQLLAAHRSDRPLPLQIFPLPVVVPATHPPALNAHWRTLDTIVTQGLADFLNQHYSLNDAQRPTELLSGGQCNPTLQREARIKAIFAQLQSRPTLILEPEIVGDRLTIRFAYWGLNPQLYYYRTAIAELPYRDILTTAAKQRALSWKATANQLQACGESPDTIRQLGNDNAFNLQLLEQEVRWQHHGIATQELHLPYKTNSQDFATLAQALIPCCRLLAGWVADIYHLVSFGTAPQLSALLPDLTQPMADLSPLPAVLSAIAPSYQQMAQRLATESSQLASPAFEDWMPPATASEPVTWAQSLVEYAMATTPSPSNLQSPSPTSLTARQSLALTHTLDGYAGKATAIAIGSDGQTLVMGSDDHTIKLWHLSKGELQQTLPGKAGRILTLALSQDQHLLAISHRTSSHSCIKVWHLGSGQLLHTLTGHNKWIYSLAISPDGQTLVSGGNKIKIWHLGTGKLLHTLSGHQGWVYSLRISANGELLISTGADKTIKIWHLPTCQLLRTLTGHSDWIRSLAICPHGEFLVSGSDDRTVRLWHLESGKLLRTLTGHSDWVSAVVINPNQQMLISGSKDQTLRLWHLNTGKPLHILTGHTKPIYSLAVSPDGRTLVSGSEDKTIRIWQAS